MSIPGDVKIPPQNIDAEQSVLGAIFLDPEAIHRVSRFLKPQDFYLEGHKIIYEAFLQLDDSGRPCDMVTASEVLRRQGNLDKVGGITYIASLAGMVPTALNVEHYARIVEEKSVLRNLISVGNRISGMSHQEGQELEELMDQAEHLLMEVNSRRTSAAFSAIGEILVQIFKAIQERYKNKGDIAGIKTQFADLDRLCCGLQPGDLTIVAARPAMGKTSFGMTVAHNVAMNGSPVAVFSLEMSKEQLVQRILCAEAMVDQQRVRKGSLDDTEWASLVEASTRLSPANLYIDDTPGMSIRQLRAKARRLKAEKGLSLIVIDYLQLLQGSRRTENRQQEIADISRSLKALAKDLSVPIMALAQLSRSVESRQDKKPIMSDLRESGSLEQDADVVMFIYRDEYYNPETEKRGIAEIIVAKHRNGPTGTVELAFLKEYTRFMTLTRDQPPDFN